MANKPPAKGRRLWGRYIESPPPDKDGKPGIINDWLQYVFLLPILLLFGAYCWFTTEDPKIDPCDMPTVQEDAPAAKAKAPD